MHLTLPRALEPELERVGRWCRGPLASFVRGGSGSLEKKF